MDVSNVYDLERLTSKLNYVWVDPPKPTKLEHEPFWVNSHSADTEDLIESLADYQWPTDFIRRQIRRLKIDPKGRSRIDLLTLLIESFLQPGRIQRQLATLNDEEQRFYTYLLLFTNLKGLRTQPTPIDRLVALTRTVPTLRQSIADAGLGLEDTQGEFYIPFDTFSMLHSRYIPFPTAPEPDRFMPAVNPQLLLTQIQQILSLIQVQTFELRRQLRWSTPRSAYGSSNLVMPVKPEDAQRILSSPTFSGSVSFYPPEPLLDVRAMNEWSAALGMPHDYVEFVYHLLVASSVVQSGSPVKINETLVQAWMMRTPGQQIVDVYHLYRGIASWGDWWTRWRSGQIAIGWDYQNYWSFYGIDNTMSMLYYMLRWVILDTLAYLPHDAWLTVDSVVDFLGQLFPTPESQQYCHPSLLRYDSHGHWKGYMRQVLLSMLEGPLYWIGLVDVAPDREHMTGFRLRRLQDLHWNRVETLAIEAVRELAADDVRFDAGNNLLIVRPPATADFLAAVQRWTTPGGLSNNQLVFRPDVQRLHTAFEQGETPETLADAWNESAPFPPLPEVARWWQYWWDRYGHIRLYPAQATLMTRDEFTMQELQVALPRLRDAILGLVTPRTALLHTGEVDQLLRDLERQGYMPKEVS